MELDDEHRVSVAQSSKRMIEIDIRLARNVNIVAATALPAMLLFVAVWLLDSYEYTTVSTILVVIALVLAPVSLIAACYRACLMFLKAKYELLLRSDKTYFEPNGEDESSNENDR